MHPGLMEVFNSETIKKYSAIGIYFQICLFLSNINILHKVFEKLSVFYEKS